MPLSQVAHANEWILPVNSKTTKNVTRHPGQQVGDRETQNTLACAQNENGSYRPDNQREDQDERHHFEVASGAQHAERRTHHETDCGMDADDQEYRPQPRAMILVQDQNADTQTDRCKDENSAEPAE